MNRRTWTRLRVCETKWLTTRKKRGSDYENIEKLTGEFNERMEIMTADDSLQPWEKISASLGYALFDKNTDSSADDIFKRADQRMYERKKEMKAMRQ
ncbi:MAG: diguanylate cyclase [Ruminococcus sp.]|nr:diguanylate cyclase [Ruminococcus sp.]